MRSAVFMVMCLFLLPGCRKSERNNDTDITLSEDVANAQTALHEVFLAVHEACLSTPGIRSFIGCSTITADTLSHPRTLTIDFGTGCVSPTGRTRKGKLIVYQNGSYAQAGSTGQVYFDTFYINGYNYSGTMRITRLAGSGYTLAPENLRATAPDSLFTYLLTGSLNLDQTAGTVTLAADDDVFGLEGTMSITGRKGNIGTYTVNSSDNMTMNGTCAEPVGGKITLQSTGMAPRVIDFGSGTCDKKISVTANTVVTEVNISF